MLLDQFWDDTGAARPRVASLAKGTPASPVFQLIVVVVAFLVLRIGLASVIPLSIDEAYAVVVSRSHSLSYFDHPPLGFALARLMADVFGCECRLAARLPYVLLGSLSTLLLFEVTRHAYGKVAAFWAAAWFTVAPFFLISAGHFVVPDGPLDFFLLASACAAMPMVLGERPRFALLRWIIVGFAFGLALMSKYQSGLFGISALLVLVSTQSGRAELRTPGPWIAGAIATLGLLPVIIWNMDHGWISFAFQTGRGLAEDGHALHPGNLAITLLGQAGYLWPPTWLLAMGCMWGAARSGSVADRFFVTIAALPVVFFDLVALFSAHSLPHWSMSGFLFAFPLFGQWCSRLTERRPGLLRLSFTIAAIVVPLLTMGFAVQVRTGAFTRAFYERAPKFDVNWQLVDWSALTSEPQGSDLSGANAYVVASNWMQAARAAAALGPDVPIEVLPGDPRHFQFMDDGRLKTRSAGFFVGALDFGKEAAREKEYRDSLDGRYVVDGPPRRLIQRIAGFPVFEILILPVNRIVASQAHLPGNGQANDGGPRP
ncbi:glycosyltransferase family 39 protein [Mesorhizobium sp. ESP7-2]|uniref:ArnT family glycosyltransferase n=1 Tax=Mesorhizobium sp. ESP7-2 TaxID=2876622 RepID=UPI001CCA9589|nr:glycosyltransferase family 39 protein [Mesorhizobium sp. ESP7-2]MBZ9708641.1 glycosyltransferase family 39 protein [Mesorhizobium sp. ESP7-2]